MVVVVGGGGGDLTGINANKQVKAAVHAYIDDDLRNGTHNHI